MFLNIRVGNLLIEFRSESLIFGERPERFASSRSFVLSDLSESLTFAHLSWAIWANEWMSDKRMSNKRMSEFPTLQNIISMVKYEVGESHGFKWYYLKDWECCIVKISDWVSMRGHRQCGHPLKCTVSQDCRPFVGSKTLPVTPWIFVHPWSSE